jgi:hypothetical protein
MRFRTWVSVESYPTPNQDSIENNKLNLSIDGFVIPFYEKLVELIKEKL